MSFTDWNTAAAYYLDRLTRVLEAQRHALHLSSLPQTRIDASLGEVLVRHAGPLSRQADRLSKKEFRIAVVGLEKAGKSTFINAWLEHDLLPNEAKRCTYTTTQVYSVTRDHEQRLEVMAKSREQFDAMVRDLEEKGREEDRTEEGQRARNDLNLIRTHRGTLETIVGQDVPPVPFTRLEELSGPLRKYVADERYVYAVLEARLYTNRLAAGDGIVFYDVPGLNSGLRIHQEQSREMLADCDAVILMQNSRTPSIEANEQKLIEFIREGDQAVGLEGKLFVFFGLIDERVTRESLEDNGAVALKDWQQRGRLPADRFVPGSAGAYLVLRGAAGESLLQNVGDREAVRSRLRQITGVAEEAGLIRMTGVPVMKERVNRYLNHERIGVLQVRCDGPIREILDAARRIYEQVRRRFPEDPEEAKRAEEQKLRVRFTEWWGEHWNEILAALNVHFGSEILRHGAAVGDSPARAVDKLRDRYQKLVRAKAVGLKSRNPRIRQTLQEAHSPDHAPDPARFNMFWRENLYEEVSQLIEEVSSELAVELKVEALALVERMTDLLWGSSEVAERLIRSRPDLQQELEGKLQTLFLRFSRPVATALVRYPVGAVSRREGIKRLGADNELLDNYYEGTESAYRQLKLLALYGRELLVNPHLRREKLNEEAVPPGRHLSDADPATLPRPATTNPEVIEEVEADLESFEHYLLEAVFAAAGFEAFCEQELSRLCDRFRALHVAWVGVAMNEYASGNPRLLALLPAELRGKTYDTEVSDRLRQLRIALEETAVGPLSPDNQIQ